MAKKQKSVPRRETVISSGVRKNRKMRRAEQQEIRHAANNVIVNGYKGYLPPHLSGQRASKVARWIVKNGAKNHA